MDNQTLGHIYQSQHAALIARRQALIESIEDINLQIIKLRKEARKDRIALTN